MKQLHNDNGRTYNVLATLDFNKADAEYYKNSWQNYRAALLECNGSYVVATLVGETSWGNGYYADGIRDAVQEFNRQVKNYLV